MSEMIRDWWYNLSAFPKISVCFSTFLSLAFSLNILSPYALIIDWGEIVGNLQLWRCLTSLLFFGKLDIRTAFQLFFLADYQNRLGRDLISSSDHVYLNLFLWISGLSASYIWDLPIISQLFLFSLISVWSKYHSDEHVTVYFFTIEAKYLPFTLLALEYAQSTQWKHGAIGIFFGYLYYYLKCTVPKSYGFHPLRIPKWMWLLSAKLDRIGEFLYKKQYDSIGGIQRSWRWGKGHRLGYS